MKNRLGELFRLRRKAPAPPVKTEREKKLEREWADLLRYEGRPLYEKDKD